MPIEIMPTTICGSDPPIYEFQMKKPRPPPPCVPPPEIISAATTTSQVMPIPTAAPVKIEGSVPGKMILQNKSHWLAPIDWTARRYRSSIMRAPPRTLITIVKNAPRKVTNAIDISLVGQKINEAGTQASGGIGRSTSKGGKKMSRKYLLTANIRPKGMPMICAAMNPVSTRLKLWYQLSQYPHFINTADQATATSEGGGRRPT